MRSAKRGRALGVFRLSRMCLAAIALLAVAASATITQRMYAHQRSLREGSRYNIAWSVGQAVTEYTRLQLAIARATQDGTAADVALRYDICLNRLDLMAGGDVAAFLATDARHGSTFRGTMDILTRLRPLLDRIGEPEVAARARAMLAPATGGLIALAAAANRHGGERVAEDEAALFTLHWMFSALAAALIAGGLGLIVLLTRRMDELDAARIGLERTAASLTTALVEADAAGRAKATFLATMSHEIRTPLNAILGLTASLLDEIRSGPQRPPLETIRDAGDGLLRLLNDILDFSKLDAGHMTLEETPFAPGALSANVASILQPRAKEKGVSLFVLSSPDLPPGVMGDPGRIEQILLNLVSNAVKFTERGHVTLQTLVEPAPPAPAPASEGTAGGPRPAGPKLAAPTLATPTLAGPAGAAGAGAGADKVTIIWRISDTGIGIPADRMGKLFGDFMQADTSITRRFGGTGLGLAISKRLIDEMAGDVAVESIAGAGSTFTVRLTLPAVASPVADTSGTHDATVRFEALIRRLGRPLRILFVEDNPTNQYVATQLLKGFDAHLDMAGNGLEALASVSRFTHDLICMDMRMPEMDGLEATRQIRRMGGRMATIPIIALTANAFKEDVDACLEAGMNRFVGKPVRRDVLLGAMLAELSGLEAAANRNLPASGKPEDMLADFPSAQPAFSPSAQPAFSPSAQPAFSPPAQPAFSPPAQPAFSPPAQPAFSPSAQPAFPPPVSFPSASSPSAAPSRGRGMGPASKAAALDHAGFDELIEMIGGEGVLEMIEIFERETRRRVARLRVGDQDIATVSREMHTLKGAAGTVAAPHLAELGKAFEAAANQGVGPTPDEIESIEDALDVFLATLRGRAVDHAAA